MLLDIALPQQIDQHGIHPEQNTVACSGWRSYTFGILIGYRYLPLDLLVKESKLLNLLHTHTILINTQKNRNSILLRAHVYFRFYEVDDPVLVKNIPPYLIRFYLRRTVIGYMHGQGIGRHTKEEILQFFADNLKNVQDFLGEWFCMRQGGYGITGARGLGPASHRTDMQW